MRDAYRPSGFFDPVRLVVSIAILLPVAGLLAEVLSVAKTHDLYYCVFVPALAVLPLAAAGRMLARWSNLRNPSLGFVIGAALAALMYVGQHYTTMTDVLGTWAIPRFDIFPAFLIESVNHEVISESMGGGKPTPWLNWS